MASFLVYVDPSGLRVPPSRPLGADLIKLHRQTARFGGSAAGMPPIWAYQGSDGELLIYNGVTRANRIAKESPGTLVPVLVIGTLPAAVGRHPTIKEKLP